MDTFFSYSHHYMLFMLLISTVTTGVIFQKNRNKENAFIFLAFVIYSITLILNLFFGYTASFDVENDISIMTSETEGLLSMNESLTLQIIGDLFITTGFGIKAYAIIKKT